MHTARVQWLSVVLALAFVAKLAAVAWAMPRGFEMGDGGYFLLALNQPERIPVFFQFYRLLALLTGGARFDVVDARVLRLGAEALGSAALIAGVWAWARARVFEPGSVRALPFVLFCLLGTLLSTASRSLSYNDVANLWGYAVAGALCWVASLPADASVRRAWAALGVGAAIGLLFGAKFPAAIALFGIAAAVFGVALRALSPRERLRLVLLQTAGVALVSPLFVATSGGVAALLDDYRLVREITSRVDYAPLDLLRFYAAVEVVTYAQLAALALVFLAARWLLGRIPEISRDVAFAAALALSAIWLAVAVRLLHPFFVPPPLLFHTTFLAFALVAFAVAVHRARGGAVAALAPLLLLVALPFLNLAGTNVPPSVRLPTHALPLFAALGVLAFDLRTRARAVATHATLCAVLVALTSVAFAQQHLLAPYGLPRSIFEQREPVDGLDVRVDAETRRFLEGAGESMRAAGFRRGDPLVAFDFMPGLVYYLGGVSPGLPIYLSKETDLACFAVARAKLDAPPWLAFGRPLDDARRGCLAPFAFPDAFRHVGSLRFPYEQVYAGFDMPGIERVELYAPRAAGADD